MIQAKISVIVPIYNVEKYLTRCLDSIVNQTYTNLEIILVNDGSTDSSPKICEKYLEDQRVQVLHKENDGLGMARNSGLDVTTGDYVLFVDSDDYLEHDMIEILYKEMLEYQADTCVGGFTRAFPNKLEPQPNSMAPKVFKDEEVINELLVRMMGDSGNDDYIEMSACKVLFSMNIIKEHNIRFKSEREFISEDLIFGTDYYRFANCVYLSTNVGYYYCFNEGSLTTSYNHDRFNMQVRLFNELLKRSKDIGILESTINRLRITLIAIARYAIKLEEKFRTENGNFQAYSNILAICNNNVLQKSLLEQDQTSVRLQSRVINYLIQKKQVRLLMIAMRIKNFFGL